MGIIDKMRKQTAVYWAPLDLPDENGQPRYDDPVEMTCRWDDTQKEVLSADGETVVSESTVYTQIDVAPKGMLMLGDLESGTPSDPRDSSISNLTREIIGFSKIPDLKARKFLRIAYLKRQGP